MKKTLLLAVLLYCISTTVGAQVQIPDYKTDAKRPGANYYQLVSDVRAKLELKKQQLTAQGVDVNKSEQFREEQAQFERWAWIWRDKIGPDGHFPNFLTGWINAMQDNPDMFRSQQIVPNGISAATWTSLGPVNSGTLNGWTFGGGIGRVNVVKRHPGLLGTMFAGTASGGIFKTTDLGTSWTPLTDQFAGLSVADLVFLPGAPNNMLMATGDNDGGKPGNSIGIFKSIDGGNNWVPKLSFTLNQENKIGHIYVDPDFGTNNTLWATSTFDIYKSTNQGETWVSVYNPGTNRFFNDFTKAGPNYFTSDIFGRLIRSIDGGVTWVTVYTHPTAGRIDFDYSPNTPDILYILAQTNPAFAKYTISTNTMGAFSNVTNSVPADGNGNYNTQQSYNQVIAVKPTDANDIMIGEFSGKRSTNGGTTWTNWLNGYYDPSDPNNWGSGYVHSDHHYMEYVGALFDSLLIGCDGGVYIGPVSSNGANFKECFQGLSCTESYSIAIFGAEPNNLIIGNQDNDGRSRVYNGVTSTWYGASAGDGISTAIHRTNKDIRYLSGTTGTLSYRNDGFTGGYSGTNIPKPAAGVFAAPLEMHLSNGDILYGGYDDVYKGAATLPAVAWTNLTSGLGDKPKFIGLSNHPTDATKHRIVAIGENNVIRKTTDETTWTTITPPGGVLFNSIYWSRTGTSDTMLATASGYTAGNKIFISLNAGNTWTNISDNMSNITMVNVIRYEGTDTVIVSTELGVYFARLAPGGGVLSPTAVGWTKLGTGLPNVRVSDMEISYQKKQLFVGSYGRGVWMANLTLFPLPLSGITFTYKTYNANNYSLIWKIDVDDIVKTVLEKSTDGRTFTTVGTFTGADRKDQPSYLVPKENMNVYYRLYYVKPSGQPGYSQILLIRNGTGSINTISVYPNPASDYVNITSTTRMATVKITTVNGQQLTYARPESNFYSFDMSLLPQGTYLIQVWDINGKMSSEKIVRN